MPKIEKGHRTNFNTLIRAAKHDDLILTDCQDRATKKPVRVICAVHFDGEIYAAIIWDLMGRFAQTGSPTWRDTLFGYLVDGMNYTPAKPAYEDMRDGILAAVAASGNTPDCARVWDSFARYGVGVGAKGTVRGSSVLVTESMTSSTSCN